MHPFIADLPEVQDIERRRADLTEAHDTWRRRARATGESRDAALRRREEATRVALLRGEEPLPPVDLDQFRIDGNEQLFRAEFEKLDEEHRLAVKAHESDLLARVEQAELDIAERRGPIVLALFDLLTETNQLRQVRSLVQRGTRYNAMGQQIHLRSLQPLDLDQWLKGEEPDDQAIDIRATGLTRR